MKISAAVVTLNEEKNIARCLKSLDFADEIVIVDSGSTDKTLSIARRFTDKIFVKKFSGFDEIKNFALSKTKGGWIFSLDADETVSKELKKKLVETARTEKEINGFIVKRNTFFLGKQIKHCGWGGDYQARFFRKNSAKFSGIVHEKVIISGRTGKIEEPIYHYSYPDSTEYFNKMNRYTTLQAGRKKNELLLLKMLFLPFFRFFRMYFLKKGFMDGTQGFILSVYSAFSDFVKYSKMLEKSAVPGTDGIVVRMPNWIGDAVMASALIRPLKRYFNKVYIVADKKLKILFKHNKDIEKIIPVTRGPGGMLKAAAEIRRIKCAQAMTLTLSMSSGFIFFLAGIKHRAGFKKDGLFLNHKYNADSCHKREHIIDEYFGIARLLNRGIDSSGYRQNIPFDRKKSLKVLKKFRVPGSAFRVVISPFTEYGPAKMWGTGKWEELIRKLGTLRKAQGRAGNREQKTAKSGKQKPTIIILGMEKDKNFKINTGKNVIDLRGKTTLGDVMEIIGTANIFIGNDSGLMHVADGLKVPLITIFGSTSYKWTGPVSRTSKVISSGIECSPCFKKTCKYGHYNCLKNINTIDILKLLNSKLKAKA